MSNRAVHPYEGRAGAGPPAVNPTVDDTSCPRLDSNQRPRRSERRALSAELRRRVRARVRNGRACGTRHGRAERGHIKEAQTGLPRDDRDARRTETERVPGRIRTERLPDPQSGALAAELLSPCPDQGSNLGHPRCKRGALPLSYPGGAEEVGFEPTGPSRAHADSSGVSEAGPAPPKNTKAARTGFEPAHALGENQVTLPIRPPRRVGCRGGIRTHDFRLMRPARTTELLHPASAPPGTRTPNPLLKRQLLYPLS